MQLLTVDTTKAQRFFWSIALVAAVVGFLTIRQTDPVLVAAAVLVMIIGLAPFYIWLLGTREGLPIWPAFSIYACTLAAMPALQKAEALQRFPDSAVLTSLLTMGGFFALGTVFWLSTVGRRVQPPKTVLMLDTNTAVQSLMWCVLVGALFQLNSIMGLIPLPGNTMQIARGVSSGLSFLGIFAMAYFHGRGQLNVAQIASYLALTVLLTSIALTGLMIANIVQPVALAVIGYTLGKGRPPWAALAGLFVLVALLHAGKYTMRDKYAEQRVGLGGLPSFYAEWLSYGTQELGGIEGLLSSERRDEESATSVFERSGNLHMLVLVQNLSPEQVPFLEGLTYAPIPQMLIPRFLMPDKSISHAGNILLSVNYGLVDTDGARNVSIGWPLIAEAYANYGYIGVFGMSILLSLGYGYATRLSSQVPITSFRFVSGLVILASVTNENTLGVFIGSQFQAIVGVAMASVFLMRRRPNPFAAEGGSEGTRQEAEGPKNERTNRPIDEETAGGRRPESGERQVAADGGVVRNVITRVPQRAAAWMPRRMRKQVLVAQTAASSQEVGEMERLRDEEAKRLKEKSSRPRQLAVPYQNYRRYRG